LVDHSYGPHHDAGCLGNQAPACGKLPDHLTTSMDGAVTIRDFDPADILVCVEIYRDAVLNGTAPHYTAREAAAWAPAGLDTSEWTIRLVEGATWIAATGEDAQGFITLAPRGHLDLFFVRPAARPLGTAALLYDRLLAAAREQGHPRLTTDASHLARRFLERRGWSVRQEERAMRNGIWLTRFRMTVDIQDRATETGG
jgi:putative acetyltransferase